MKKLKKKKKITTHINRYSSLSHTHSLTLSLTRTSNSPHLSGVVNIRFPFLLGAAAYRGPGIDRVPTKINHRRATARAAIILFKFLCGRLANKLKRAQSRRWPATAPHKAAGRPTKFLSSQPVDSLPTNASSAQDLRFEIHAVAD